ncbi:hypothetical protein Tco_1265515 [Tanacetum coccineum]
MANLSEDIQCASSDTRPPMLDRTDFASWQQRIRLYCQGPERPQVYSDLSPEDKERHNADIRATNILLQGLPKDIYTLINHYTDAKDIWDNVKMLLEGSELTKEDWESQLYDDFEHFRQNKGETIHDYYVRFAKIINDMRNIKMTMSRMQLNSKFVNNMLPEWGRFVTAVKLNRGLRDSNYDQLTLSLTDNLIENLTNTLALLTQSYKTYLPQTNNQLRTFIKCLANIAPVQDGRVVVQNVQGRHNRGQGNNARGACIAGYGGAQNRAGNANPGQARQVKCYNCNAPENRVELDKEQLLFLAGGHDNAVDEDVDEQPVQDLALNVDNILCNDEADPSYDSDILSKVHDHDQYQDAVCEHHKEHEMHDDVQPNYIVDSHADYTSDSNMITYDHYVKDNAVPIIQSNVSSVPNDAYMMIYNDMYEPHAQSVSKTTRNTVVDNSLTAELANIRKQVECYEDTLINHYTDAKDIWYKVKMLLEGSELTKEDRESQLMQLNSKFINNMLPEWGRFVTTVKLIRGLRDSNYDQLYAYLKQHEAHANENKMILDRFTQHTIDPLALMSNASHQQYYLQSSTTPPSTYVLPHFADNSQLDSGLSPTENLIEKLTNTLALLTQSYKTYLPQTNNQLRTSSNTRNQARVQDGRVVVQNVQGRQNRGQGNNARGAGATGYEGAQNRVGNANPGQARQIKCYNCNGIGRIARNRTQPKRPQNSEYFKDKMLLMQAQENEVALDEEQLLFIACGQDNVVDEDVDEQPVQDLALNVDNVFQADDCDAFDSNVDEAPTAQTMFMENLSYADPIYDEASPLYDLDILSEVPNHDNYQDAVCEHHEVDEMHDDVQPNYVVDSHADYTSDSNMIPYDQYVKDNAVPVVQSNVSSVPNDAYRMILNDIYEPSAQYVFVTTQNNVVDKSLTAELATYKEQVELRLALSISKMKAARYPDFGLELLVPEQISSILRDMILRHIEEKSQNTCGFSVSSESNPIQDTDLIKMKAEALKMQTTASSPIKELMVFTEMHDAHTSLKASCLELEVELSDLRDKIQKDNHNELIKWFSNLENKLSCVNKDHVKPKVLAPGKYAIDVEPIPPRNRNNREVHLVYPKHLKESVETLHEIVEEANVERPLDSSLASACRYTKHSQELLEYVIGTCPKDLNTRDNKHASTPLPKKKQVSFEEQCAMSKSNIHKLVEQLNCQKTNVPMPHSTGVNSCTDASRS